MEKQEKIIREFFSKIEEKQEQSPKELPPRSGEKYRFAWKMEGDQGDRHTNFSRWSDYYLTADTQTFDNDEYKMLQLLNWLNGWSHYGIFTYSQQEKIVFYEQTHFCRFFEYTVEEINDFYRQMIKRISIYKLTADDVFNNGTDIEKAVDMASDVVKKIHN